MDNNEEGIMFNGYLRLLLRDLEDLKEAIQNDDKKGGINP